MRPITCNAPDNCAECWAATLGCRCRDMIESYKGGSMSRLKKLLQPRLWGIRLSAAMLGLVVMTSVQGQEESSSRNMYYPFEPDITTNFIKLEESRHLGYVRVGIEAVVDSVADMSVVEHHDPLLRNAFIEIFGQAQEGKVRSLAGREELRQESLARARELLERETGRPVIRNLIFTTYLYQ